MNGTGPQNGGGTFQYSNDGGVTFIPSVNGLHADSHAFMGIYTPPIDPTVHCDGFKDTFNGINIKDNVNFYAPMLGPGTPNSVYFGTDRLYRSSDRGTTMTVVSHRPIVHFRHLLVVVCRSVQSGLPLKTTISGWSA